MMTAKTVPTRTKVHLFQIGVRIPRTTSESPLVIHLNMKYSKPRAESP